MKNEELLNKLREYGRALGQLLDKIEGVDALIDADAELNGIERLIIQRFRARKEKAVLEYLDGASSKTSGHYIIHARPYRRLEVDEKALERLELAEKVKRQFYEAKLLPYSKASEIAKRNKVDLEKITTVKTGKTMLKFVDKPIK